MRPSSEVASFSVTSGRPRRTPLEEAGVDLGGFGRAEPGLDRNSGGAQACQPAPGNPRIGVFDRGDDPRDARLDQRIGAGRRPPPMAAGFERDVSGGAAGGVAGAGQGLGLGMRTPAGLGPAPPHHPAILENDAADRRVGPDIAEPAARQRQCGAHRVEVNDFCCGAFFDMIKERCGKE